MSCVSFKRLASVLILSLLALCATGAINTFAFQTEVKSISPPKNPIPPEAASADVTKFSFIVYGDTRGRRDGAEVQYEHWLIVDSAVATIKRLSTTAYPVKFVLQTGDAVLNGQDPNQWNISYIPLINRLTTEAGVPYFLAPGNHDVTNALDLNDPRRLKGLENYLKANSQLIPPEGSPRRLSGYPTFSFGYGNTFVIGFDSNIGGDDKQFDWVKQQLESLDRKRYPNAIVFCHQPAFSSGPHEGGAARMEPQTVAMRTKYMPLFRRNHVTILFAGHEHLFEHWIERYEDNGRKYRMDEIVTGGGGAPIYTYNGEPDIRDYIASNKTEKVTLEHFVKPGMEPGNNPYHYVVVRVDGEKIGLDVVGVDWGRDFAPYRSKHADLGDPK